MDVVFISLALYVSCHVKSIGSNLEVKCFLKSSFSIIIVLYVKLNVIRTRQSKVFRKKIFECILIKYLLT